MCNVTMRRVGATIVAVVKQS